MAGVAFGEALFAAGAAVGKSYVTLLIGGICVSISDRTFVKNKIFFSCSFCLISAKFWDASLRGRQII